MQIKLTVLLLLGCVTIIAAGILKEKHFQKAIDEFVPMIPVPPSVSGALQKAAKQMVHKIAKLDSSCILGHDRGGKCNKGCQETVQQIGYCHGTKCKCGVPLGYR
uniref:Putative scorpine-like peptide n=1 Tax=Superstitionia donensis TaxID=311983 RepID=A0A1V1WBP4_9SCOR